MNNSILNLVEIVQNASLLTSTTEQIQNIVDSVCKAIQVDVCSLYRMDSDEQMVLLASHGLTVNHPIKIPAGRGLVGLVASSRHPLNIDDAATHPDYYYVALSKEENFHSFCGVPLVRRGEVIGILVAQREKAEKLDSESEAFLVTLATHLALVIPDTSLANNSKEESNVRFSGVVGAPGIAIGHVRLSENPTLDNVTETSSKDVASEIASWQQLLARTQADIEAEQEILGKQISTDVSGIFDAYLMLLSDHTLHEKIESGLRKGQALPWALKSSINYFTALFNSMEDRYLRARGEDIYNLGNKLYQLWLNSEEQMKADGPDDDQPVILLGAQISASDIASVPKKMLAGIVCFEGSALSHTAVLANALGIPAIMGLGYSGNFTNGEQIIIDGNGGNLIRRPSALVVTEYQNNISSLQSISRQLSELRDTPAITLDGVRIELFTNTGLTADILPGLENGAEGVGLYRTEIPFMIRQSFPSEDEQVEVYRTVCNAYQGKPVYFRTLDIGGDKQLPYFAITGEENPALGWRGIRFSLDNIQLLMTQVRAIIRAADNKIDLHILIPMISSTEELDEFIYLLDDALEQLRDEGLQPLRPKIGVMVEVPASISLLQFWVGKIDFISIGSNDLSQYLLALDRDNARVANRFDHVHPAIINEISRIASISSKLAIPLSVCGELASDPIAVILLIGMGVRRLSMSSSKIPRIKWLLRSITTQQASDLLDRALALGNASEIRQLGQAFIKTNELDQFSDGVR